MEFKAQPLVSFVILNWNGRERLINCLRSVEKVKYSNKEIIVINNGSNDDSHEFVKKYFPGVKLTNLKKNIGYAGGKNLGVKKSKGKYILCLDNDTLVTPEFLSPLVEDLEKDKTVGIVQPQIRSMIYKNLLDSVGSFLTFNGFLYHYGYMKPYSKKIYKNPLFAYSIKGACFLMAKKDYQELGGLDASFLSYIEETDLCHRLWLSGKKVLYDPRGVIYHWGGGDTLTMSNSNSSFFRTFRNRYYSYIKNFSSLELVKILPIYFLFSEGFVIMSLLRGKFLQAFYIQLGNLAWILKLPELLKKRRVIQRQIRKVEDSQIQKWIKRKPRLEYYWYLATDIKKYKD